MADKKFLLRPAEQQAQEGSFSHPWNPNSLVRGTMLGKILGLKRTGVSIIHLASGKESFVYHSHHSEEEWMYILSGRGIAEIDDEEFEVAAGDFMAFPTPSVAHHLRNPFAEELTYLVGGENRDTEIADFPRLGKRMIRKQDAIEIVDHADIKPFGPLGT